MLTIVTSESGVEFSEKTAVTSYCFYLLVSWYCRQHVA